MFLIPGGGGAAAGLRLARGGGGGSWLGLWAPPGLLPGLGSSRQAAFWALPLWLPPSLSEGLTGSHTWAKPSVTPGSHPPDQGGAFWPHPLPSPPLMAGGRGRTGAAVLAGGEELAAVRFLSASPPFCPLAKAPGSHSSCGGGGLAGSCLFGHRVPHCLLFLARGAMEGQVLSWIMALCQPCLCPCAPRLLTEAPLEPGQPRDACLSRVCDDNAKSSFLLSLSEAYKSERMNPAQIPVLYFNQIA